MAFDMNDRIVDSQRGEADLHDVGTLLDDGLTHDPEIKYISVSMKDNRAISEIIISPACEETTLSDGTALNSETTRLPNMQDMIIDDLSFTPAKKLTITQSNLQFLETTNQWKKASLVGDYLTWPCPGLDVKNKKQLTMYKYKKNLTTGKMERTNEVIANDGTEIDDEHGYNWGQCVSFVKACSHSSVPTKDWIEGHNVSMLAPEPDPVYPTKIEPGTVIATFDQNLKYRGHVAIYMGSKPDGFMVWDQNFVQWDVNDGIGAVGRHLMVEGSPNPLSNGYFYHIVYVKQ